MRTFWIIWKREVLTYFRTPLGVVLSVLVLLLTGCNFYTSVALLNHVSSRTSIVEVFFNNPFLWTIFVMLPPFFTMSLFSEEYKSGTIETLMTAPVRDVQVVLAKFFAALFLFFLLWSPTLLYFILFWPSAHQVAAAGYGAYAGAYGMLLLQGLFYLSIGSLASVMTSFPLLSALISLSLLGLIVCGSTFLEHIPISSDFLHDLTALFFPRYVMRSFSLGFIDTRPIVFYVTLTGVVLFITLQIFHSRRWWR